MVPLGRDVLSTGKNAMVFRPGEGRSANGTIRRVDPHQNPDVRHPWLRWRKESVFVVHLAFRDVYILGEMDQLPTETPWSSEAE